MCDQTEILYLDGDVVWVKLGSTWWPGEVLGAERTPPDAVSSLRKPPIAVVKFFREETLEFVKNLNSIYKYNCSRKHEFIKKGMDQWRSKHTHMELFPEYVREAEERTHGDPAILQSPQFQPPAKVDYNALFGQKARKTPGSPAKLKGRPAWSPREEEERTPTITHPRILQKLQNGTSDYRAHILVQEPRQDDDFPGEEDIPGEGGLEGEAAPTPRTPRTPQTPVAPYTCHACPFSCTRINVMVLHNRCHSEGYVPYTPPKRHKPRPHVGSTSRAKTPRARAARPRVPRRLPRSPDPPATPPLQAPTPPRNDPHIKSSLLADWSEDSDESMDILTSLKLTASDETVPLAESDDVSDRLSDRDDKENVSAVEDELTESKTSEDAKSSVIEESGNRERKLVSCFDFDDEDDGDLQLPVETIGRKIPRLSVKSEEAPKKSIEPEPRDLPRRTKAERKISKGDVSESTANDSLDLDVEIHNLLEETAVPDLPSLPDDKFLDTSSKTTGNIESTSDKEKSHTKSIFKTKTFFRSRHTRSQDAIEKYVADNTSSDKPPTYMEESPEPSLVSTLTEAPPAEVKIQKFAPKIQLKKMKAALGDKAKFQIAAFQEETTETDPAVVPLAEELCSPKPPDSVPLQDQVPLDTTSNLAEQTNLRECVVSEDNPVTEDIDMCQKELECSPVEAVKDELPADFQEKDTVLESKVEEPVSNTVSDQLAVVDIPHVQISPTVIAEEEIGISSPLVKQHKGEPENVVPPVYEELPLEIFKPSSPPDVRDRWNNESVDNLLKTSAEDEIIEKKVHSVNDLLGTIEENVERTAGEILTDTKLSTKAPESQIVLNHNTTVPTDIFAETVVTESTPLDGPTESDLQIAETLINLPTSGAPIPKPYVVSKMSENDQNISAAKSLVQMSVALQSERIASTAAFSYDNSTSEEQVEKEALLPASEPIPSPEKTLTPAKESSKLFQILDEPTKLKSPLKIVQAKPILGKEKILNFQSGVAPAHKPRVIIRRGAAPTAPRPTPAPTAASPLKSLQDEDAFFDINSMPIVLSEEIITPETLNKIPHVISESPVTSTRTKMKVVSTVVKESPKAKMPSVGPSLDKPIPVKKYGQETKIKNISLKPVLEKTASPNILSKSPKVKATKHLLVVDKTTGEQKIITAKADEVQPLTKFVKSSPNILPNKQPKSEKFIILPPGVSPATKTQKIIVNPQTGKSQIIVEEGRSGKVKTSTAKIIQNRSTTDPGSGNTVMILTNAQGVQSKIVLTPEHQRMLFSKKSSGPVVTSHTILSPRRSTQALVTSRGQLLQPITGNALITSTGQLLPPRGRTVLTAKPNQTILTSRGQLLTAQTPPVTSQARPQPPAPTVVSRTTRPSPVAKAAPTVFIKSSASKLLSADPASILQGKKSGTVMHLTAAQFEHLQKTGQIIAAPQPSLTQIVSSSNKSGPGKVQTQKFILQKYAPNSKQATYPAPKTVEKKIEYSGTKRKVQPAPALAQPAPPPLKKQKLRELLTFKESGNMKKYSSPMSNAQAIPESKPMDLGNLDDLIPATTISTRKGEVRTSGQPTVHVQTRAPLQRPPALRKQTPPPPEPIPPPPPAEEIAPALSGDGQLLAVPGENFGGPPNSFYLCMEENGTLTPVDNQPLVLENNQLVPMILPPPSEQRVILNAGEQQILVDQQTLLSLLGGERGAEGQQLLLQGDVRQLLAALAPQTAPSQDILAAALADTGDSLLMEMDALGPDFQNLNAGVSALSNVSETSTALKPIMSAAEQPSKRRFPEEPPPSGLEDSLAVLGVTPPSVPTSLDLPITVTDPRIAPKVSNPLVLPFPVPEDHKLLDTTRTTASLLTRVSQTDRESPFLPAPGRTFSKDDFRRTTKQLASSMPCLDDSSSDSFVSDNPQLLGEDIQTKTYSPISMPLLTEDVPEEPVVKSMPVLAEPESSTLPSVGPYGKDLNEEQSQKSRFEPVVFHPQAHNETPEVEMINEAISNEPKGGSEIKESVSLESDIPGQNKENQIAQSPLRATGQANELRDIEKIMVSSTMECESSGKEEYCKPTSPLGVISDNIDFNKPDRTIQDETAESAEQAKETVSMDHQILNMTESVLPNIDESESLVDSEQTGGNPPDSTECDTSDIIQREIVNTTECNVSDVNQHDAETSEYDINQHDAIETVECGSNQEDIAETTENISNQRVVEAAESGSNQHSTVETTEFSSNQSDIVETTEYSSNQSDIVDTTEYSSNQSDIVETAEYSSNQNDIVGTTEYSSNQSDVVETAEYISNQRDIVETTEYSSNQQNIVETTEYGSNQQDIEMTEYGTNQQDIEKDIETTEYSSNQQDIEEAAEYSTNQNDIVETTEYSSNQNDIVGTTECCSNQQDIVETTEYNSNQQDIEEATEYSTNQNDIVETTEYSSNQNDIVGTTECSSNPNNTVETTEYSSNQNNIVENIEYSSNQNDNVENIEYSSNQEGAVISTEYSSDIIETTEYGSNQNEGVEAREYSADQNDTVQTTEYISNHHNIVETTSKKNNTVETIGCSPDRNDKVEPAEYSDQLGIAEATEGNSNRHDLEETTEYTSNRHGDIIETTDSVSNQRDVETTAYSPNRHDVETTECSSNHNDLMETSEYSSNQNNIEECTDYSSNQQEIAENSEYDSNHGDIVGTTEQQEGGVENGSTLDVAPSSVASEACDSPASDGSEEIPIQPGLRVSRGLLDGLKASPPPPSPSPPPTSPSPPPRKRFRLHHER